MGYLLAMSAEFRDWLADLSVSDPASARLAGAALAALLAEGAAPEQLVEEWDFLDLEDIRAALRFAASLAGERSVAIAS